jgi:hypothetical protein
MAQQAPLKYVFYIAATPEKVWEGFVSLESNRIIFSGAELQRSSAWWLAFGGPRTRWQAHELRPREGPAISAATSLSATFAMGANDKPSRATIELVPETEATKVTVTHDEWAEDDTTYAACADDGRVFFPA